MYMRSQFNTLSSPLCTLVVSAIKYPYACSISWVISKTMMLTTRPPNQSHNTISLLIRISLRPVPPSQSTSIKPMSLDESQIPRVRKIMLIFIMEGLYMWDTIQILSIYKIRFNSTSLKIFP